MTRVQSCQSWEHDTYHLAVKKFPVASVVGCHDWQSESLLPSRVYPGNPVYGPIEGSSSIGRLCDPPYGLLECSHHGLTTCDCHVQLPVNLSVLSHCYILRFQFTSSLVYFQSAIHSYLCDWDIYGFGIGSRPLGFRQCGEGWGFQTARGQKCTIVHSVFLCTLVHLFFSKCTIVALCM